MKKNDECCATCRHYTTYCNLMDEIVQPADNCGMYDRRKE